MSQHRSRADCLYAVTWLVTALVWPCQGGTSLDVDLPGCDSPTLNMYSGKTHNIQSCQMIQREPGAKDELKAPRGHGLPFGYHQKSWARIEELDNFPDPETFYREYMRKSRPLLVKGGVASWPAQKTWHNVSYLRDNFGDYTAEVMFKHNLDPHHNTHVTMSMKDYLSIFQDEKAYYDSTVTGKMLDELNWPKFLQCDVMLKWFNQVNMFFNAGWSSTDLHLDITETFFAQVAGAREWYITRPETVRHLYTDYFPFHTGISPVDKEKVDLYKYPNVAKTEVFKVVAEKGDIVYVPEGWFHQVRAKGNPNIAIAIFLHWLKCSTRIDKSEDSTDVEYVRQCQELRKQQPKEIKCNIPYDKTLSMSDFFKQHRHFNPEKLDGVADLMLTETVRAPKLPLNTGKTIPSLGYGVTGDLEAVDNVKLALHLGCRLFDTTMDDNSEMNLAKAIKSQPKLKRSYLFIVAKIHPNYLGYHSTKNSIKHSLKNLQMKYVDLLILQAPSCDNGWFSCTHQNMNESNSWQDSWRAMEEAYKEGQTTALGVGHFNMSQLKELLAIATLPVSVVWDYFDYMNQKTEVREFASNNNITFIGHSILGNRIVHDGILAINPVLRSPAIRVLVARSKDSAAGVALRWGMDQGVVATFRTSQRNHIRFNWKALSQEPLDEESMNIIDGIGRNASKIYMNDHDEGYATKHKRRIPDF